MDYCNTFASFHYSSGESVVSSSDAQNVDFGTSSDPSKLYNAKVPGNDNAKTEQVFNVTRENVTSDFGVVNYPFGVTQKRKKERAIPAAISEPKIGARMTAGHTRGVMSGGGMVGTAYVPPDALKSIRGTLEKQNEISIDRFYVGQLG